MQKSALKHILEGEKKYFCLPAFLSFFEKISSLLHPYFYTDKVLYILQKEILH